jgi:hypothetical protein
MAFGPCNNPGLVSGNPEAANQLIPERIMRFQVNLVHMLNSIHLKMLYDNEWAYLIGEIPIASAMILAFWHRAI